MRIAAVGTLCLWLAHFTAALPPARAQSAGPFPDSAPSAPLSYATHGRYADSAIILRLKPGRRFAQTPPGLVRSGSPSLDQRLARASAFESTPIFPIQGANRRLHAALGMDRFYRIRLRRPADIPRLAAELSRHPDVEWAEPDYLGSAAENPPAPVFPNDPAFGRQWGFWNGGLVPGIGPSTPGADIKAPLGWTVTTGDSDVVVAVLDSGIRPDAVEFAGRVWTNPGEIPGNGVDDDENGYVDDIRGYNFAIGSNDISDDLGHGTAVSGVIGAAANNGVGYAGLDWGCRIMPVKVLNGQGFGFYTWWVSGIYYAVNKGARILNMSLVGLEPSLVLQTAIRYAYARGCFIAAAMGNSGSSLPFIPASYENEVVAVGATDLNDRRAFFSTYGHGIDVVAPGQDIAVLTLGNPAYTSYGSGTSFATPMVSGLAALLLAKNPSLGPDALRDIICATADDQVGAATEDTPGFDPYHGFGRINCYTALTLDRIPHAPTVSAPSWFDAVEGQPLRVQVTASDPDGDPIVRLDADLSVLPQGHDAVFTASADQTSGELTWTPQLNDEGLYSITFRAFDPLRGTATTLVRVSNTNQPPTVTAPPVVAMAETEGAQFDVQAEDPDLEAVTLTADGVPSGARFADNANNTGTFIWVPDTGQAGSYRVVFAATDAIGEIGTAATRIEVSPVDSPPVIAAPQAAYGAEGQLLSFEVVATDPDGDAIGSLSADLTGIPPGTPASFTIVGNRGTFAWTPGFTQSGSYAVYFTAANTLSASFKTTLFIEDVDRPPAVTAPSRVTGVEDAPIETPVTAADPDGDPILSLGAGPLPVGATFALTGNAAGTIRWKPDFGQAGIYDVLVSATSALRPRGVSEAVLEGTAAIRFEIANLNRAPAADAGGPYLGVEGATVAFDGRDSSDPDGDLLVYRWRFGDGAEGTGAAPLHPYDAQGQYRVVLDVSDGWLSGRDSTTAQISGALPARAFLASGRRSLSLTGGSSDACLYLEPVNGSYINSDLDLATLALVSEGTGTVSRIAPILRSIVQGDRDRNGVGDLSLCFTRDDLRRLFASVGGRTTIAAAVEGREHNGAKVRGPISLVVVGTGSAVSVSSNPLAPGGTITMKSGRDGAVRVRLFDARGRLVRVLLDQPNASAGYHDVPFDGRGPGGARVPSGIYFLVAESPEGIRTTRVAILK